MGWGEHDRPVFVAEDESAGSGRPCEPRVSLGGFGSVRTRSSVLVAVRAVGPGLFGFGLFGFGPAVVGIDRRERV